MSSTSKRFIAKLRSIGIEVPEDAIVRRTYAGHWQRSEGAWSSYLQSKSNIMFEVGWYEPMRVLLRCPTLSATDDISGATSISCNCKSGCVRDYHINRICK